MSRVEKLLLPLTALASAACQNPASAATNNSATGSEPKPPVEHVGAWQAPRGAKQVPIWPATAPDGTFRPQPPESVETYDDPAAVGGKSQAVLNIAMPTMTIMPAKGVSTHVAVIVFPGGGFQKVFIDLEGTEICNWLTAKGRHLHRLQISRTRWR